MNEIVKDLLILLAKVVYCITVYLLFGAYVLIRFIRTGWVLFERKPHTLPPSLERDFNNKFIQLSTAKLHYVEEGDASAPPMIFIHGFPEFWYTWRHQIKHFGKNYRVIAYDQRGYGQSEHKKAIEDYKVEYLIGDLKELIEKLGYKKATVIGHDWGGLVAWAFAAHFPEYVDRLVIMNAPHPRAYELAIAANKWQILKSWYVLLFQVPWLGEIRQQLQDMNRFDQLFIENQKLVDFGEEQLEAFKATFQGTDAWRGPINYYRAMTRYPDAQPLVKRTIIQPKTLIIWGEDDHALTRESGELSVKQCANATIHFLPGISHWVQQQAPDEVNKLLEQFMSS